MYRNQNNPRREDWENRNQSRRAYNHPQQYHAYGDSRNYQSYQQDWRPEQNRPDAYGSGYNQRGEYRRNQNYNYDYDQSPRSRHRQEGFRGSYRLDNHGNVAGYQELNERNFGPDYGYGHAGNSRTGGNYGRSQSDYGTGGTYGASRNAGSMGSYGGAQGYGSSGNGYNNNEKWGSGRRGVAHQPYHTVYGAYRDSNSFAPGEQESYDGSQRSGSQGADNTRGWTNPGRSGRYGNYHHYTSDEDARYEIYDTALSQYNRGDYNNNTDGSITDEFNLRSHQEYSPRNRYGSRERSRNRQGTGSDQDRYLGSDLEYQNTAGSLSVGYDGYRGEPGPQNRYYDPLSGNIWNPGSERS